MDQLRRMLGKNNYKSIPQVTSPRVFTYKELSMATGNFRASHVIGRGKHGNIYFGQIVEQRRKIDIAVKDLRDGLKAKELKEWVAVIEYMDGIEHPNLVKMLGYHASDVKGGTRRFLVYQYMENRSIQDHLLMSFSEKFTWQRRLSIAQDASRGLSFLHHNKIVMRCFKPSVVLLDNEFNVKLSDYMLSMLGPFPYSSVGRGRVYCYPFSDDSIVYESPWFMRSGCVGSENDVWGFGVFLLELITGRRATELSNQHSGRTLQMDWVANDHSDINEFKSVLDRSLQDEKHVLESAHALAAVAKMCLTLEIKKQPSMSEVLVMINKIVDALEPL